jgi:hypothetical protein
MAQFFTPDLEFYHDKGGLTTTSVKLMESIKNGICRSEDFRLRREVVKGSLQVYPLNHYGAILVGEHVFYVLEKGKPERLDGIAKFTHVWQYQKNEWKMARILSYDHQPAPSSPKAAVALSEEIMRQYVGKYEGPKNKDIRITRHENGLQLQAGELKAPLFPMSENQFFLKERDIEFEFIKDQHKVLKMIVREKGVIVEEAQKMQ